MEGFDFYQELQNPQAYEALIPERQIGLIVALLYQKQKNGDLLDDFFSEEVILECIRQVEPTEHRTLHVRDNQLVQKLQNYFIWRDEEKNLYQLKRYAVELCDLIYKRLEGQFNPTQTERLFKFLNKDLNEIWNGIHTQPTDFNHWVDDKFVANQNTIGSQVEILDKKMDDSIKILRKELRAENNNILRILQVVDAELGTIKAQADELDSVFMISEDIKEKVEQLNFVPDVDVFEGRLDNVNNFLSQNSNKLRLVRRRIDKIHPRIQQLFGDLRKREFDLKTERFLGYLLEHSKVSRSESNKVITLPKNVPLKTVHKEELDFTHVNKKSFLPPRPVPVVRPVADETTQKLQQLERERVSEKKRVVQAWLSNIHHELEERKSVVFSPFYYEIVKYSKDGLAIATEVAYNLIKKYRSDASYKVTVGKELIWKKEYPKHTICEIKIQK